VRLPHQIADGARPTPERIGQALDYLSTLRQFSHVPDYIADESDPDLLRSSDDVRHRFLTVNGCRLHVVEAGDPDSTPVILLHGFPQHAYVWRELMLPLAQHRHVVALDLRGFGLSDAPRRGYDTSQRVADVLAVLDALGAARADVVGHDWGAWLGFRLALDHPDRVRRLVSISMVHPWVLQRHLIPNLWRWWVTALFEIPGAGEWVLRYRPDITGWLLARDAVHPEVWTAQRRHGYTSPAAEPARAAAGRRLHSQLILRDIPRLLVGRDRRRVLEAPTLIIGGDDDALLPPSVLTTPRRLAQRVRVRTIPGGHYLVDEAPEQVLGLILEHLN
jgi:pimeloyl-ACP methyl ester carboxylesterase